MAVLITNILFFNFNENKKSISQKFGKKYVYFFMLLYRQILGKLGTIITLLARSHIRTDPS